MRKSTMPEKKTIERAEKAKREGKAPTTQAGEFVREEMEHIREGQHGAASPEQTIAIGSSKARRAGVKLPPPENGTTSEKTRRSAKQRGDLIYTKPILLAIGDMYQEQIAKDRTADAPYH
jgi:hypothetical protein